MQMDTCTRFTQLCIGLWPLACRFQVLLEGLLPIVSGNIKIDDDMVLGHLQVMQSACVQICQLCLHILPFLGRCAVFVGILRRTVLANIIQNRLL